MHTADTTYSDSATTGEKSVARLFAADTAVYVVLTALVWGTWKVSQMGLFKAGDDLGYWLGVTGGVMMLLLFIYPMRKHFRFASGWGRMKFWFVFHMILGVGGPLLILLHSTFHIGSLNAGVALYSMLIVAGSGVIGRYIYSRINRGLKGEQVDLKALQSRLGLDQEQVRSRLAFAPQAETWLKTFEETELQAKPGLWVYLRRVLWLPLVKIRLYYRCAAEVRRSMRNLADHGHWSEEDFERRLRKAQKMLGRYLDSVVGVAQYTAYERLFSLWHVAHIPFVYLLILSAIVHVVAVHAY